GVGVHSDTHRAAGVSPFEACCGEDAIEAFGLGGALDGHRAGGDEGVDAVGHSISPDDFCCGLQIAQAAVRATADEDAVDCDFLHRRPGGQAHVVECSLL